MAFEDNIEHRSKHVPWGGTTTEADYVEIGVDWSDAAFVMNFATTAGGTPIAGLALTVQAAGTQGINATYDADYVDPETGAVAGATTIRPFITEATLEGVSWGSTPADQPLVLYYDLLVTPAGSGELQRVYAHGTFTLYPGIGD